MQRERRRNVVAEPSPLRHDPSFGCLWTRENHEEVSLAVRFVSVSVFIRSLEPRLAPLVRMSLAGESGSPESHHLLFCFGGYDAFDPLSHIAGMGVFDADGTRAALDNMSARKRTERGRFAFFAPRIVWMLALTHD